MDGNGERGGNEERDQVGVVLTFALSPSFPHTHHDEEVFKQAGRGGCGRAAAAAAQVRAPRFCPLALCFVKRERRVRVECSPGKVSERLVRSGIAPYLFSNQLHWVGGLAHAVARRGYL
jgi:hypothetical protein